MVLSPLPQIRTDFISYDANYFQSWGRERGDSPIVEKMKRKTARRLLKKIEQFIPRGRLLDVGCAAGHFLEEATIRGWDAYGVEISDYAADLARQKLGDRIYHGSYLDVPFPRSHFQAILMSDVIEHLPDPLRALHKAGESMSPRGILAIVTPNTESLSATIMRARWPHLIKEHLMLFSPRSIHLALKNSGFRLLKIEPSVKWMNLSYLNAQLTFYRHPIAPVVSFLTALLPKPLKRIDVPLVMGDMLVLAQKENTSHD